VLIVSSEIHFGKRVFSLATLLLALLADISPASAGHINEGWRFLKEDANGAETVQFDDSDWQVINLPHTWSASEALNKEYYRGVGWYRKKIAWGGSAWNDAAASGGRVYVRFGAAGIMCNIYVNGRLMNPEGLINHRGDPYTHKGGYSAFTLDITDAVHPGEDVVIAARVRGDADWQTIAPLGMDFTIQCGLYRNVDLFFTGDLRMDRTDHGSCGIYITPTKQALTADGILSDVNNKKWDVNIRSCLVNSGAAATNVTVDVVLRRKRFEGIDFNGRLAGSTYDVAEIGQKGNPLRFPLGDDFSDGESYRQEFVLGAVPAGQSVDFNRTFVVDAPRLWNGESDPALYDVAVALKVNGQTVDQVNDTTGFRYYHVDKAGGFYLNGNSYPLHGVALHEDFGGTVGKALTPFEQNIDFSMIYETGANTVRLSHYQHDDYFYELCDRYGLVVWAEIPLGGHMGTSEERSGTDYSGDPVTEHFMDVTEYQLSDLIRQNYNRSSICFWGLQNEVNSKYYDTMRRFISRLNRQAHQIDPVRLTAQAICFDSMLGWETDLIAWNTYPRWYFDITMKQFVEEKKNALSTGDQYNQYKGMGISEYGAGGSPVHHEIPARRPPTNGPWHPEEWQNVVHEDALQAFQGAGHLWTTYLWVMFDFASSGRSEGSVRGLNDKGLVTRDRDVKKDAFYLYKANWNKRDRFVHITSSRFRIRHGNATQAKAYSNCDEVFLYGTTDEGSPVLIGEMDEKGAGIFVYDQLPLDLGTNEFFAVGKQDDSKYRSEPVSWVREPDANIGIHSLQDHWVVEADERRIVMHNRQPIICAEALSLLKTDSDAASLEIKTKTGEMVSPKAIITPGMKLVVTAENPGASAAYTFEDASGPEIDSWEITSRDFISPKFGFHVKAFNINHEDQVITVFWDRKEYFDRGDFMAGLHITGSASCELEAAAFYITEGDSVVVKSPHGEDVRYTIHFDR
jgi:hypothetical protein